MKYRSNRAERPDACMTTASRVPMHTHEVGRHPRGKSAVVVVVVSRSRSPRMANRRARHFPGGELARPFSASRRGSALQSREIVSRSGRDHRPWESRSLQLAPGCTHTHTYTAVVPWLSDERAIIRELLARQSRDYII